MALRSAILIAAMVLAPGCGEEPAGDTGTVQVTINDRTWRADVADTTAERRRGLQGRASLTESTGMLFVFPEPKVLEFWMKGCLIDLDIAFISDDMRVVKVVTMRAEPTAARPRTYSSDAPAMYALEVPAGELARAGVRPGSHVRFSRDISTTN